MKYIVLILISMLLLFFPTNTLAQKNISKDASYYYNYIQNKKSGTRIRVKLKNGEKPIGRLTQKHTDHFEMVNDNAPYAIYYSDIADIGSGYSKSEKLKFSALLPYKIVETAAIFVIFTIGWSIP